MTLAYRSQLAFRKATPSIKMPHILSRFEAQTTSEVVPARRSTPLIRLLGIVIPRDNKSFPSPDISPAVSFLSFVMDLCQSDTRNTQTCRPKSKVWRREQRSTLTLRACVCAVLRDKKTCAKAQKPPKRTASLLVARRRLNQLDQICKAYELYLYKSMGVSRSFSPAGQ